MYTVTHAHDPLGWSWHAWPTPPAPKGPANPPVSHPVAPTSGSEKTGSSTAQPSTSNGHHVDVTV